jgi:splicing factor 3B subunit 3
MQALPETSHVKFMCCCFAVQESVHFFRYNKTDNKLYCFADDVHPRYITAMTLLDYDTVAAADKFGNFFVLRLPADVSAQVRTS